MYVSPQQYVALDLMNPSQICFCVHVPFDQDNVIIFFLDDLTREGGGRKGQHQYKTSEKLWRFMETKMKQIWSAF